MTLTETDHALMECCDRCQHTRMSHAGGVLGCERSDCSCEEFAESDEPFAGYWDLQTEMMGMKRDREKAQGEVRTLKNAVDVMEQRGDALEAETRAYREANQRLHRDIAELHHTIQRLDGELEEERGRRWRMRRLKSLLGMW